MMDAFWQDWLGALFQGLHEIEPAARGALLGRCGQRCAAPSILPAYRALRADNPDTHGFFMALETRLPGVKAACVQPGRVYDLVYPACGCPLHTQGGVNDPILCECSRRSLAWVMGELFPGKPPEVTLRESVLLGAPCCRLRVTL